MSFIQIKNDALVSRLGQAADRMGDTTPLSAAIANTFAAITEDNFDAGGRPKWAGLARIDHNLLTYTNQGICDVVSRLNIPVTKQSLAPMFLTPHSA